MSAVGDPGGPASRLRLAGFACLAVAAVAFVLGVVTLFSGDEPDQSANPSQAPQPSAGTPGEVPGGQPPPAQSSPAQSSPTQAPAQSSPAQVPPVGTDSPAPGQTPPASGPASGAVPPGQPGSQPDRSEPVRVYNNSTVKGLADRAAEDVRLAGWNVVQVDNYSQGLIATTTVYYRPGTAEEDQARALANTLGLRVEPRFPGISEASPGIVVIVTREYQAGKNAK